MAPVGVAAAAVGVAAVIWATGQIAGFLDGGGWPDVAPADLLGILTRLPGTVPDPAQAWPETVRAELPGPFGFYLTLAFELVLLLGGALWVWRKIRLRKRTGTFTKGGGAAEDDRWGRKKDLKALVVPRPTARRLTLGTLPLTGIFAKIPFFGERLADRAAKLTGGRAGTTLISTEERHSVIVFGPTGSMKTTGFAVPAILEWKGPVLATSVKNDLLDDTVNHRRGMGEVAVYDPSGVTGQPAAGWSPLAGSVTWDGANRTAKWLSGAQQTASGGAGENGFWYTMAEKLLSAVFFAAANDGKSIEDVIRWIDTQEQKEVAGALKRHVGENHPAFDAAKATFTMDAKMKSSVFSIATTILDAYTDEKVGRSAKTSELTPEWLFDAPAGQFNTAYLCAPSHEQERLQPLFATLVQSFLNAAYERKTINPPLLLMLDEAANIASLPGLATLVSTARGIGIQVVTVWQDKAQIDDRYGQIATTVINNHRAKVVLSGISDTATLDYVSGLLGEQEMVQRSSSKDAGGWKQSGASESAVYRSLASSSALRRIEPGRGVLIYGHLAPTQLQLRPWFLNRQLTAMVKAPEPEGTNLGASPVEDSAVPSAAPDAAALTATAEPAPDVRADAAAPLDRSAAAHAAHDAPDRDRRPVPDTDRVPAPREGPPRRPPSASGGRAAREPAPERDGSAAASDPRGLRSTTRPPGPSAGGPARPARRRPSAEPVRPVEISGFEGIDVSRNRPRGSKVRAQQDPASRREHVDRRVDERVQARHRGNGQPREDTREDTRAGA